MIKQNKLQFDMDTGWQSVMNHIGRGKGHIVSYLWNRFKWNYYHRMNIVPNFPLNVDIESSSKCNIKCDHCFRQYMDMHEYDFMPMETYRKVVDECAKNKLFTLKFSMRGEPTLHPNIVEMVEYAKNKGIKEVWINTHGGQLNEKMCEGFVKAKLDYLMISFDGIGEMYESIRIPLKYEKSLAKVKLIKNIRTKLKAKKPVLKVQSLWSAIKHNPDEYLNIMGNIVDKVSYNLDFDYDDIHFTPDPNYVCYRLWQRISITSRGDVLKCPSDFEKDEVLGNINNTTIKELWDTKQKEERDKHLNGRRLESIACMKCHHGALVKDDDKVYCGKQHDVNEITYEGAEFEGHGLNRENQK